MKCSVCGYEFDESRGECPLCGTPAPKRPSAREPVEINFSSVAGSFAAPKRVAADEEIVWNTFDFPKPRTIENIDISFAKEDGSPDAVRTAGANPEKEDVRAEAAPEPAAPAAAEAEAAPEPAAPAAAEAEENIAAANAEPVVSDADVSDTAGPEEIFASDDSFFDGFDESINAPAESFISANAEDAELASVQPNASSEPDIRPQADVLSKVSAKDDGFKPFEIPQFLEPEDAPEDDRYGLYNELSGVLFKDYDNEDGLTAEELFGEQEPVSDESPEYSGSAEPVREDAGMQNTDADKEETVLLDAADIFEPAESAEEAEENNAEAEAAEIAGTAEPEEAPEPEADAPAKKTDIFFNWIARAEEIFSSKNFDHVRVDKESEDANGSEETAAEQTSEQSEQSVEIKSEQSVEIMPEQSVEITPEQFGEIKPEQPGAALHEHEQPEAMRFDLTDESHAENEIGIEDEGEVLTIESILSGSIPNDELLPETPALQSGDEAADDEWLDQQSRRSPLEAFGMTQHGFADGTKPGDEKFFTFAKKNDEFQSLLNKEYERLRAVHSDETVTAILSIAKDEPRNAAPVQPDASEETKIFLHSEIKSANHSAYTENEQNNNARGDQPAAQPKAADAASDAGDLVEVSSAIGAEAFTKNTVETKIAEMKAAEEAEAFRRSEHKKHLEEMKKAREAYFALRDEESGFKLPETEAAEAEGAQEEKDPGDEKTSEQPQEPNQFRDSKKLTRSIEDEVSVLVKTVTQEFREQDFSNRIKSIVYSSKDDDDTEIEYRKGHPLLTFLLVIIIVVAVIELICIGCRHFIPDMPITSTLTQLEQAFKDAFINLWGSIKRLFVRMSQGK